MKTKLLLLLAEPLLVAKVVLCWIIGLPVFALCFSGVTLWDSTVSRMVTFRRGRDRSRFQLRRARA